MGFIMALARKIQLQNKQTDVSFQLTSICNQLSDLKDFGSILAQDRVQITDIAAMPSSLFSLGLMNLTSLDNAAAQRAEAEFAMALNSGAFGPNPDPQTQMIAKQKMYENARKEVQKILTRQLNDKEKDLQNKKARLDADLNIIQQQLQSMDKMIAQGIQTQIGTFGVQG